MSMNKVVRRWLYGLTSNYIMGGANSVTAGITASMIAPDKFNLSTQLWNFILLVFVTFTVNGILGAMSYLKANPLPPEEDEEETKK